MRSEDFHALVADAQAAESVFNNCDPEYAESAALALHLTELRIAGAYAVAKRDGERFSPKGSTPSCAHDSP